MQLVFDPSTLRQSRKGSVTGVVYFDFGEEYQFPAGGWNDFVVVLANWWLAALDEIARTRTQTVLRFMDGPYWIKVVAQEGSKLLFRCTEDRRGSGAVQEAIVSAGEFERELTSFGSAVSRACAEAGIASADVDNLRRLLSR